jgi:ABC-type nitrate/sulfonate/bicarbonate transport system substrate-binding protein
MAQALRVGAFSPSIVLRVARSAGVLARYGVDVVEQPVPSSTEQFRALLDGSLDAALTSPDNVIAHRLLPADPLGRTADVRIVLGVDRGLGLALYGRPGVGALAAVRGGVVGVDVAESGFAFALYEILAAAGLRRDADYTVVELGSTPRRADALIAGECDATMLNAGNDLRAAEFGCRRLRRAVDVCQPYLGTVLAATGTACEQDGERLGGLVAALRAVLARLAGMAEVDRTLAVEAAAEALRLGPAAAQRYVDGLRDPAEGLIGSGEPDEAALAAVLALRRRHTRGGAARRGGPAGPDLAALPPGLLDRRFLLPVDRR